jgi:hypothetical protein
MPPAARAFALAFLLAASARAAQPQDDRDALLDAVADPAARQLLTLAIGEIAGLKLALASLQRNEQQPQDDGGRRLQRTGEDSGASAVHIYTRSMQRGAVAPGRGRRQAQQDGASGCWTAAGTTGVIDVEGRTAEIHAACCGNPDDCSTGAPSTCDATCAAALLPFWDDCGIHLRVDKALWLAFHEVVRECQEADVSRADESLYAHLPHTHRPVLVFSLTVRASAAACRVETAARCSSR